MDPFIERRFDWQTNVLIGFIDRTAGRLFPVDWKHEKKQKYRKHAQLNERTEATLDKHLITKSSRREQQYSWELAGPMTTSTLRGSFDNIVDHFGHETFDKLEKVDGKTKANGSSPDAGECQRVWSNTVWKLKHRRRGDTKISGNCHLNDWIANRNWKIKSTEINVSQTFSNELSHKQDKVQTPFNVLLWLATGSSVSFQRIKSSHSDASPLQWLKSKNRIIKKLRNRSL